MVNLPGAAHSREQEQSRAIVWEERSGAGVERLSFLYDNDPLPELDHRSSHHLGVCALDPAQLTPTLMQGVYFTDRYTKGSMYLKFIGRSREYSTFEEAAVAAGK